VAFIGDCHLFDGAIDELSANDPSRSASAMNGLSLGRFFRGDRGKVDRVRNRAANQIIRHLLGDLQRDIFLRLTGRGAEVRRADDIWMAKQWIFCRRFVHEHIEGRACDMAGLEQGAEGRFVYEATARAMMIRTPSSTWREFDRQDVFRLRRYRRMQGMMSARREERRVRPFRRRDLVHVRRKNDHMR